MPASIATQAAARYQVRSALASGRMVKPKRCQVCDTGAVRLIAHHYAGYAKPLRVWWICESCNRHLAGKHAGQLTLAGARKFVADKREAVFAPALLLTHLDRLYEAGSVAQRTRAVDKIARPLETKLKVIFQRQGEVFVKRFGRLRTHFQEALTETLWLQVFEEASGITRTLFFGAVQEAAKAALLAGARDTVGDIGLDFAFNLDHPQAVAYLQAHGYQLISQIDEVTRQRIGHLITTGTAEGWSYDRTAREITRLYREMAVGKPQEHIASRAHLISITESGEAYEHGGLTVAQDLANAGLQMEKSWLTVGDAKVSDGCAENARAGWIPLVQPFPSGHQRPLRFPSCRCTSLYRRKRTS